MLRNVSGKYACMEAKKGYLIEATTGNVIEGTDTNSFLDIGKCHEVKSIFSADLISLLIVDLLHKSKRLMN